MLGTELKPGALAFLQQGYRNNWQQYLKSLDGSGSSVSHWDICVLTASNDRQADAYEAQLEIRREAGLLPANIEFRVIADPGGRRIGSGGATLRSLSMLAGELARPVDGVSTSYRRAAAYDDKRILVIHSGGDSQRLPHCSATGKMFARIPHELPDGRASSLFDEFLVSLTGLPGEIPGGVLIATGDVLLLFDHLQLTFRRPGVTGVSIAASAETGTLHSVYVTAAGSRRVNQFLHKPSLRRLRETGAVQADGRVLVDTGLVWMDPATVDKALEIWEQIGNLVEQGTMINLYGDLLVALASGTDSDQYLQDATDSRADPSLRRMRQVIWDTVRGTPLSIEKLDPAVFVHFDTTHEYLSALENCIETFASCGWSRQAASWTPASTSPEQPEGLVAVNTFLHEAGSAKGFLLDSLIEGELQMGERSFLANVIADRTPLLIEPGLVLHQLPLRSSAYATRLFGVDDDPKHSVVDGGTFLNKRWKQWFESGVLEADDLWPHSAAPGRRSLWNARLFPACASRQESLDLVLWLQSPKMAPPSLVSRWRAANRMSLQETYDEADARRVVDEHRQIADLVRARHFCAGLEREQPAKALASLLGTKRDAARRARNVADWLENASDPWLPLRGYWALAVATGDHRWGDRAFSSLARLVRAHTPLWSFLDNELHPATEWVTVSSAARIDFGGGWTDTPPYSLERGGMVLNAAITLSGRYPITAEATLLDEPILVLESEDLEASLRPQFAGQVLNYASPADPFALLKAAMVFRGIIPGDAAPSTCIAELLAHMRHGLRLRTSTCIPRGSGLGTSSILAGTILQCLAHLLGHSISQEQLFDEVLCLEQMITTGGGWQDQVGGLVGGIKLTRTRPGLPQVARVDPLPMTPSLRKAFHERLRLVYTGQRRLAKDILRAMMGRYMARDTDMVAMLRQIGQLALAMRNALAKEDLDTFGALIGQHWQVNKRMDPDSTNPFIDGLMSFCEPYMVGAKLAGAGGGGFAIVVARDAGAAEALEKALASRYTGGNVGVWPCAIAEPGMISALNEPAPMQ